MHPGRRARHAAGNFRRRYTDAAKERMQRNIDAVREVRDHLLRVERNDPHARIRKIFRDVPASGTERVVGVWNGQLDFFNPNFEHVTRLGVFYKDWASENVTARPFVRDFAIDVSQRLLNILGLDARTFKPRRTRGYQRLNLNRLA